MVISWVLLLWALPFGDSSGVDMSVELGGCDGAGAQHHGVGYDVFTRLGVVDDLDVGSLMSYAPTVTVRFASGLRAATRARCSGYSMMARISVSVMPCASALGLIVIRTQISVAALLKVQATFNEGAARQLAPSVGLIGGILAVAD